MPYVKWCILEAIRLRAPGAITRRVVRPLKLQVNTGVQLAQPYQPNWGTLAQPKQLSLLFLLFFIWIFSWNSVVCFSVCLFVCFSQLDF